MAKKGTLLFLILSAMIFYGLSVFAMARYNSGEAFVIGEFIYDDDYAPTTTNCYLSIWSPDGVLEINNTLMTASTTGWHYYNFAGSTTLGVWPATMICGTAGVDLVKGDKTFMIASASVGSAPSADAVASAVWASSTRSLTDYSLTNIANAVWAAGARTLSSFGTLRDDVASSVWSSSTRTLTSTSIPTAGEVASAVWSSSTRTLTNNGNDVTADQVASAVWATSTRSLTTFGSLVSDVASAVWASTTRSLTAFGSLAADVWNAAFAPTRRLTDATLTGGGTIATKENIDTATSSIITEVLANRTLINNLNNISAADVWAYGVRKMSSGGNDDIASAVWASSTRSLTNYGNNLSAADVWNVASSSLSGAGTVGKHLVDNLNATIASRGISNLTAADVWLAGTRTLTDYSEGSMAAAVWASSTRTLTNYGNDITAADVWNVLSSTLTTQGTIGKQVAENANSSTIASAVWASSTRTLTSFGSLVSDVASAVWASSTRTITSLGAAAADVWNDAFAPTRRLTDANLSGGGSIATKANLDLATSTLMTEILANQTLINNLNDISAADVWSAGTRTLTSVGAGPTADEIASAVWASTTRSLTNQSTTTIADAVWNRASSQLTQAGTIGKLIADNLDAQISSRGTSNLTAADVWSAGARTLTDYSTSTISAAVWANGARTLTNYGNNITAQDVWDTLVSTINTDNSIGKLLKTNIDTTISSRGTLTKTQLDEATSTIITEITANRTLINNLNNISATDVWAAGTRTLTSGSGATAGEIASAVWASSSRSLTDYASVWNVASSSLSGAGTVGKHLVDNLNATVASRGTSNLTAADVWNAAARTLSDQNTSTIASAVWANAGRTLTNYGNDISATDVWAAANRTLTSYGNNLSAADVWGYSGRTLTDYSTSTIAAAASAAVWDNAQRTLTNYGNNITAADVWNVLTASLSTDNTIGKLLASNVDVAISSRSILNIADLNNATSTIINEILSNRTLINNLNDISATDVWAAANRTLTDYATSAVAGAVWSSGSRTLSDYGTTSLASAVWAKPLSEISQTGSVGKLIADNLNATISSRGTSNLTAADVWNTATRTLTDYSTSSISAAVSAAVWANAARTLTNYGNDITATDVWNVLTSALTTDNSIGKLLATNMDTNVASRASLTGQTARWDVFMSDYSSVQATKTYRAKIQILNSQSVAAAPFSAPTITLYDAERNTIVSNVAMTNIGTGVYEYTYTVPSNASQGVWEAVVNTQVESGKVIINNDYFSVQGSPAQVIINSVTANSISDISANVTITNEGLTGYEYQYEWCVVSEQSNTCGGGDDTYYGSGAKFINPSEDWNTNLTATVSTAGAYYFKLVVHFGAETSGSTRSFNVSATSVTPPAGGGGGGGGGGTTGDEQKEINTKTCVGADFNHDKKVNSTDFSIMLAFWKSKLPFANPCVDINGDRKVDSVDFSIFLSQWGTSGKIIKAK